MKSVKYLLPVGILIALVWIVAARSQPQDQFTNLTPIPSVSAGVSNTPGTPKPGVHANDGVLGDEQWALAIQSPDQYIGSKVDLTGRIFNILGSYGGAFHFQMYTDPTNQKGNTDVAIPENTPNLREGYTVRVEGTFQEVKTTTSQAGTDLKIPLVDASSVEVVSPQLTPTDASTGTLTPAETPAAPADETSTPAPTSPVATATAPTPTPSNSASASTATPTGAPPTPTPTDSASVVTPTPTWATTPTATPTPYAAPSPTATPYPTQAPMPSPTPTGTAVPGPTQTPAQTPMPTPTATPQPQPSPTATTTPQLQPSPTPTATPQPQPSPTPTVPVPAASLFVGNTGGEGVYIRRTPAMADKIKAWPDGTKMVVVGLDTQAEGHNWKNVRDPDGNVGWVPAEYLTSSAPAPAAPPPAPPAPQPQPPSNPPAQTTLSVGNTGGDGVYIRRTPAMDDKIKAWPDGTPMQVMGPDTQAEGRTWKNVRDPDGNVGWVPAEYLH